MPMQVAVAADHGHRQIGGFAGLLSRTEALTEGSAMRSGLVLNFAAEREIFGEGEKATSFYKVVSGVVRTCKFLSDGCRQIDAFYTEGDVFGLESGPHHWLTAEAVNACTVVAFPRHRLDSLSSNDGPLAQQFFSYALQCLERAQGHSILLGRRNAAQKVAAFLLEMLERAAEKNVIELAMTRQDIGDYLGLTIETVSRTFSHMERDGLIALPAARRVKVLDREGLADLSE